MKETVRKKLNRRRNNAQCGVRKQLKSKQTIEMSVKLPLE
jgi:hypothetical protein